MIASDLLNITKSVTGLCELQLKSECKEDGKGRKATVMPLLSATHSAGDTDQQKEQVDMNEQNHTTVKDQARQDEGQDCPLLPHHLSSQFALELPLCDQAEIDVMLPASATATEAVRVVLARLHLTEPYREQGIQCAIMDITSRTRGGRGNAL